MRYITIFLVLLVAIVAADEGIFKAAEYTKMFTTWVAKFKRAFKASAFASKLAAFTKNVDRITRANAQSKVTGFTCGINKFADLTPTEVKKLLRLRKPKNKPSLLEGEAESAADGPAGASKPKVGTPETDAAFTAFKPINWLSKLTPVKDQGQCGSCWSFAATATVEAAISLKYGVAPPVLSEQILIDCIDAAYGCDGGWATDAFAFMKTTAKGAVETSSYGRYQEEQGECRKASVDKPKYSLASWQESGGSDKVLYSYLTKGAVGVAIDADTIVFYKGGIVRAGNNCTQEINHAVTVVGANTDAAGVKHWIVRNSWGADWGEQGYFRMQATGGNLCGIHETAQLPIVA